MKRPAFAVLLVLIGHAAFTREACVDGPGQALKRQINEDAHVAPLLITADALTNERTYAPSISLSVAGIDLLSGTNARYIAADDPAFAERAFDDRGWTPVGKPKWGLFEPGRTYWVRWSLIPDSSLARLPVDLATYTQGAMEIHLNGELVERFGEWPGPGSAGAPADGAFIPHRRVRLHFALDGHAEVLAVRFALTRTFSRLASEEFNNLQLALNLPRESDRIDRMERNNALHYGLSIGVELIILLLSLVIYLRGRSDNSWLLLAGYSLLMALVGVSNLVLRGGGLGLSLLATSLLDAMNPLVYPLALLFLVLVMRAMFSTVDRRSVLLFALLTATMVTLSYRAYNNPEFDVPSGLLTLGYFFEVARQAVRAVRGQVHGRWIIATGAVLFLINGVFIEQFFIVTGSIYEAPRMLRVFMRLSYYLTMPVTIAIFLAVRSAYQNRMLARQRDELDEEVHQRTAELRHEKERSDQLLLNILPEEVAEELKDTGAAQAKHFDQATIFFSDFKGFTEASEKMSPQELVAELNTCFKAFDGIITARGIEKIKTIGDAYMCVGGLPDPKSSSPADVVHAALEMKAFMRKRKAERDAQGKPAFEMRVGIHTGPVVAGIVGTRKFQYDIWGDTVNTASRMESSGEVGKVNISEATHALVKDEPGLTFTPRGKVQAKGKGEMEMFFVRRSSEGA